MNGNGTQSMTPGNGPLPGGPAVNADVERLREDFRTFLADLQTLMRNAGNLSGEGAALARAEMSRRLADAQERFGELRQNANDQAARLRSTTEDYVRREPFKAVGIAAAVGALVALLLSRR
jgi:ElaB/YqjD/DUF883 family membrane-anchored ribosome-binding protein